MFDVLPGMELTLANRDGLHLQQSKAPVQVIFEVVFNDIVFNDIFNLLDRMQQPIWHDVISSIEALKLGILSKAHTWMGNCPEITRKCMPGESNANYS